MRAAKIKSPHAALELGAPQTFRSFDGARVVYRAAGTGYPVMVASPIGLPLEFWQPLFDRVGNDLRLIIVQGRGFWESEPSVDGGPVTLDMLGRDLSHLAEVMQLNRFGLLAYCSGAAVAMSAWNTFRSKPQRALFVSVPYHGGEALRAERMVGRLAGNPRTREVVLEVAAAYAPPTLRPLQRDEMKRPGCLESLLEQLSAARRYSFPLDFGPPVPCGFVVAEQEFPGIRAATERYVSQLAPERTQLLDLPDTSHFFLNEQPDRGLRLLSDFFLDAEQARA